MIIQNGTIEFITVTGVTLDSTTGHPVAPQSISYGCPIPCQYIPVNVNLQAKSNDESIVRAKYTILIEQFWNTVTERLRLKDRNGSTVGEFPVISAEPLDAVYQHKITV